MTFRFIVKATRKRFMEPDLHETMEYYITADSRAEAHDCLFDMLHNGGWDAQQVTGEEIFIINAKNV